MPARQTEEECDEGQVSAIAGHSQMMELTYDRDF